MSEIRVADIIGENGTAAVNFSKGINISSGIVTATSFSGSGANLTGISGGKVLNYVSASEIPNVLNGMGISILTTSKGVISNKKAELFNVGGELLCQVW